MSFTIAQQDAYNFKTNFRVDLRGKMGIISAGREEQAQGMSYVRPEM